MITLLLWVVTACTPALSANGRTLATGDWVRLRVGSASILAKVMADDRARARGLAGVKKLASDRGMLFLFDRPRMPTFWMKGMLIGIDMIFILKNRVVRVAENVPPPALAGRVVQVGSGGRADMVLEVAAGFCRQNGVKPGSVISILQKIGRPNKGRCLNLTGCPRGGP